MRQKLPAIGGDLKLVLKPVRPCPIIAGIASLVGPNYFVQVVHSQGQPGTHFQGVRPVVVIGQGKIHELIAQQAAAGLARP